jgi:pimeloyl-ACP methyl ester carboxylesterase
MPIATVNGIKLYHEDAGDPAAPAILLIMGLGRQIIAWPPDFVADLVARGFRVISFDNRDIGLSTHLHDAPVRNFAVAIGAQLLGLKLKPAYALTDMAQDALALLDALGIARAHVVGVSMGGMIAQIMAATAPDRVLSLVSIMSTSGARGLPGASPALRRQLIAPRNDANAIAHDIRVLELTSFPDPARPADAFADFAARSHARASNPRGTQRQLLAILADGSRADRLARITAPTLVIHGAADPLVPPAGGRDTAARIKGARFELVEAMAHDLPPSQLPRLAALIADHVAAA